MLKELQKINEKFERVAFSDLADDAKSREYAKLMTEMENKFQIPISKNDQQEKENEAVVALYKIISASRSLLKKGR